MLFVPRRAHLANVFHRVDAFPDLLVETVEVVGPRLGVLPENDLPVADLNAQDISGVDTKLLAHFRRHGYLILSAHFHALHGDLPNKLLSIIVSGAWRARGRRCECSTWRLLARGSLGWRPLGR